MAKEHTLKVAIAITRMISTLVMIVVIANFRGNAIQIAVMVMSLFILVGLPRKVLWIKFLANFILCYSTLLVFIILMPVSGRPDLHFLEVYFKQIPSLYFLWFVIIISSFICLWCIHIFSVNKNEFENKLW